MNKKTNLREDAITLVALVVTIIVLLILAGITISLVLNNNGILGRAQYGSNTWANATKDETAMMGQMESDVDSLTVGFIDREGTGGGSGGSGNSGATCEYFLEYGEHKWEDDENEISSNGTCLVCGYACPHNEWEDVGSGEVMGCPVCNMEHSHEEDNIIMIGGVCSYCGINCAEVALEKLEWGHGDPEWNIEGNHVYSEYGDGRCSICKEVYHQNCGNNGWDRYTNYHICRTCGRESPHDFGSSGNNEYCTICGVTNDNYIED